MNVPVVLFVITLGAVSAVPDASSRIVGGQGADIKSYPEIASLQHRFFLFFWHHGCSGVIVTSRAVITSAICLDGRGADQWRVRVGSSYLSNGGTIYDVASIVIHPRFNRGAQTNDIAMMHTKILMTFGNSVKPARLPPNPNYVVPNNRTVEAAGWGPTKYGGGLVDRLQSVEMYSVNQTVCALRYNLLGRVITEHMLCAGVLDVGGRGTCGADAGGPIYYNGIVVGLISYGQQCALPEYPSVSTRITSYLSWIQVTA